MVGWLAERRPEWEEFAARHQKERKVDHVKVKLWEDLKQWAAREKELVAGNEAQSLVPDQDMPATTVYWTGTCDQAFEVEGIKVITTEKDNLDKQGSPVTFSRLMPRVEIGE